MSAITEDRALAHLIGVSVTHANALRRAQLTLHRWAELECGDSNAYASWAIERGLDGTDRPYMVTHYHAAMKPSIRAIPDRERGALARVAKVCTEAGLHYFHQTDPRGCALYVAHEPLTDTNYTRGIACVA